MAATLTGLGLLYVQTQRFEKGTVALNEALQIFRELSKTDPTVYQPKADVINKALMELGAPTTGADPK